MKKILALTLTSILLLGGTGITVSANESKSAPVQYAEERVAEAENKLYLVPGTYMNGGEKVLNTIADGATKLTDAQCEEIFTENAYLCSLSAGATLPVPVSVREDAEGNAFAFNGWWTIVDATVTYFDKVPELSENTFLYADWRADLSQRKEPVETDATTAVMPNHYMSILRADTGETENITLRVSGTDIANADNLGYDRAVQLYNGWFELNPGDVITVYSAGLGGSTEIQAAPLKKSGQAITLESSGDGSNVTANYLTTSLTGDFPTLTYRKVQKSRHFRIYIKFSLAGAKMAVYLEPMEL